MDIQTNFLNTFQCVVNFWNRAEKDVRIFQLGYHDFSKGKITPHQFLRKQEFYTLHLVLSGKGKLNFNEKTYDIEGGDVFALPPDVLFSYYPDVHTPWSYVFFVVYGDMLETYFHSVGFGDDSPVKRCKNVRGLLPALFEIFEKRKNDLPVYYFEVLPLFFQTLQACTDGNSPVVSEESSDIVKDAIALIALKFLEPDFSVQTIPETLHVSYSWLCSAFKKKTGLTMIGYVNDKRMKYAEDLLLTTNLKASKISYMSGFNEYTYFLMLFKRRNNMTTMQYRHAFLKK